MKWLIPITIFVSTFGWFWVGFNSYGEKIYGKRCLKKREK